MGSKIRNLNIDIPDINQFRTNMENLGYESLTTGILSKNLSENGIINISLSEDKVTVVTLYNSNNDIIDIPDTILENIESDINSCL